MTAGDRSRRRLDLLSGYFFGRGSHSRFRFSTQSLGDWMSISCHELAQRIEELQPEALPRDVARLCLLVTNYQSDLEELEDDSRLTELWHEVGIRLQAATDQHAAIACELEELARSNPRQFTLDQIWTLIRAIKVQSQVLQLYVGKQPVQD
jgi:hypothetical protein